MTEPQNPASDPSAVPGLREANVSTAGFETPAGVVALGQVRRNLDRVVGYAARHGLRWRPHVKTHKSPEIARMQLEAGASGLTVATPREAEVMASVSSDLLLAHPPVGSKAERILRLPEHVRLRVALDSTGALEHLGNAAVAADRTVGVLVEVDVGMGRVGVQSGEDAVALATIASDTPGIRYDGVLFYPGHIRATADDRVPRILEASERLGGFLAALRQAGLPPEIVSGGSTPTLWESHLFEGLTEIRAGTCVYHDRDMISLGIADRSEVAYWVEATVVSVARPGQVVLDAGSKALSKEVFRGDEGGGFGVLLDPPHLPVVALSEEHGILRLGDHGWRPRVGDRVRVLPNHVCVSVNLQDELRVADSPDGNAVLELPGRGRRAWPSL